MIQRVLKKPDFKRLVNAVSADNHLFYGPVHENNSVILSELDGKSEIVFDYLNVKLPGKHLFFPWSEAIFAYRGTDIIKREVPDTMAILFGLRPCDTYALTCLDKIFAAEDCIDPYYTVRRYNALILSFACKSPAGTCFCTEVSGSPIGTDGADIIVYDLGDTLYFEAISEAGEDFLQTYSGTFSEPGTGDIKAKNDFLSRSESHSMSDKLFHIDERMKELSGADGFWEEISEKCLGCGVCTFLCPTCHCFVLKDEIFKDENLRNGSDNGQHRRLKVHDSCMFSSFTREASGHNPRQETGTRVRQRLMHKFFYAARNYNELFCVGCGRCIVHCPVNLDIREIIRGGV